MIQGIGEPQRWIKWMQFQRGNNGGHGVWCSYAGHENNLVDDGINHTYTGVKVNEDMFSSCCFFKFFFFFFFFVAFLINNVNIKPRHCSVAPDRMKRCYWQPYRVISADWSNNIWNVTGISFFLFFKCCSSPVFLLRWVSTRSKWSLSSDITCQSRQEKCSLKVTLLWCLYSACHYVFHFLWAKIYNLSFDRRSKHL